MSQSPAPPPPPRAAAAREQRALVERFISAYNRVDVPGMLALTHPDVVFENVSGTEVTAAAAGREELRRLAEQSARLFARRRQTVTGYEAEGDTVTVHIDFEGELAADLPNGMRAGDTIRLAGKSIYHFRDGLIDRLTDVS